MDTWRQSARWPDQCLVRAIAGFVLNRARNKWAREASVNSCNSIYLMLQFYVANFTRWLPDRLHTASMYTPVTNANIDGRRYACIDRIQCFGGIQRCIWGCQRSCLYVVRPSVIVSSPTLEAPKASGR